MCVCTEFYFPKHSKINTFKFCLEIVGCGDMRISLGRGVAGERGERDLLQSSGLKHKHLNQTAEAVLKLWKRTFENAVSLGMRESLGFSSPDAHTHTPWWALEVTSVSVTGTPALLEVGLPSIITQCGGGPVNEDHISVFLTRLLPFSSNKRWRGQLPNGYIWSRKDIVTEILRLLLFFLEEQKNSLL